MDNFAAVFRHTISEYPDALHDRKMLKGVLSDVFPQSQREINLLLTGFDVNATNLLDGPEDALFIRRAIARTRLIKEHGITSGYATWIVDTWLYALGVDTVESTSEAPPPICEDDFVLIEDGGVVELAYYKGNQTEVAIPSQIDGKSIQSIGSKAFRGNTKIERVVIETGVIVISEGAFSGCTNLTSISIPPSVERIGELKATGKSAEDGAFAFTGLREISIPSSVTMIGAYTFSNSALEDIRVPESVQEIGKCAFEDCQNLTEVLLPTALYSIPQGLFKKCKSLTKIGFPNDLYEIGSSAFSGCKSITSVELPHRVVELGKGVFSGCTSLSAIYVPHTVIRIADSNAISNYIYTYTAPCFGSERHPVTVHCHPKSFARKYAKAFKMKVEDWSK